VLAFVAGLSIRTEVLYLVGLSGLAIAFLRRPNAQLVAGICVGISLLLFGLETISEGARPLPELPWFEDLLHNTVHAPMIGFVVGFVLALLVQSNTAAALIVIALARAGTMDLPQASMIIYGTNLGTIVIRIILAAGLRGSSLQVVRFEDFFCLASGVLMVLLFYAERWWRLPLVVALAQRLTSDLSLQLAVVFLLSNLLPALVLWPLFGAVGRGLNYLWPREKLEEDAVPKFLHPQAYADPATALDLVLKEESRLLRHAGRHFERLQNLPVAKRMTSDDIQRAFASLEERISEFNARLARNPAVVRSAERLKLAQQQLSLIGDLEETAGELAQTLPRVVTMFSDRAEPLVALISDTWNLAVRAADSLNDEDITKLREATRKSGALFEKARAQNSNPATNPTNESAAGNIADSMDLCGTVERLTWMLHHLSKLLAETSAHRAEQGGAK
jgi:phosphate:Na+ symporter